MGRAACRRRVQLFGGHDGEKGTVHPGRPEADCSTVARARPVSRATISWLGWECEVYSGRESQEYRGVNHKNAVLGVRLVESATLCCFQLTNCATAACLCHQHSVAAGTGSQHEHLGAAGWRHVRHRHGQVHFVPLRRVRSVRPAHRLPRQDGHPAGRIPAYEVVLSTGKDLRARTCGQGPARPSRL